MDLLEELGLEEKHELVYESVDKEVYAHTIYYEVEKIDYDLLITENEDPVDNLFSEKQQRLYVDPLYSSKWTNRDFWAGSNVAIYYAAKTPPIVPDMFLSFDVKIPKNLENKKNKCYFVWLMKKSPELVVEIVSNKEGKEKSSKVDIYAQMGVKYYVIQDSYQELSDEKLQVFQLVNGKYELYQNHQYNYMPEIDLGVMLWTGIFEDAMNQEFARWCEKDGTTISTGKERADLEAQRANKLDQEKIIAEQKAKEEAERADLEAQRANTEAARANLEAQKTQDALQEIERLKQQLASLGLKTEL
ncbi:MAG: Uma2 family endonuclease [Bacteroidetes bacterium]|nr:MAG: Uma2 family endonuclease [Bacteroidota bacterium]